MAEVSPLFGNILVPTDGSASSISAGKLAIRLAGAASARLTFLYVVDESVAAGLARASAKEPSQVQDELAASGQRSLDYLTRLAKENGLEAAQISMRGEPFQVITDYARNRAADLIVVGKIGRHGLQRILIGSVTERIIENAHCPVLVVQ
jgi:nucleotide-binding universal stress UspA family protein